VRGAAEEARIPGQPHADDKRRRHYAKGREAPTRLNEPMSEFCSQSHAPLTPIGKKRVAGNRFRPCGYPGGNPNDAIQLARKTQFWAPQNEQGPRQANEYAT
jgi:hypothetical protein